MKAVHLAFVFVFAVLASWILMGSVATPQNLPAPCLPPGVPTDFLRSPQLDGQVIGVTPGGGQVFLVTLLWQEHSAQLVIVSGEIVYVDLDSDNPAAPPWVRPDLSKCEWVQGKGSREGFL